MDISYFVNRKGHFVSEYHVLINVIGELKTAKFGPFDFFNDALWHKFSS